jgi:serine/threonine-protein kinase HipA
MIEKEGKWSLSPAYDLLNVNLANPSDKEELALNLEGRKRKFTRHLFERFGTNLGLNSKQIQGVFNRFSKNQSKAKSLIDASFLSENTKEQYWSIMLQKLDTINKQ